ncbi:hypothetical protein D3C72_1117190 [compost metagenome]
MISRAPLASLVTSSTASSLPPSVVTCQRPPPKSTTVPLTPFGRRISAPSGTPSRVTRTCSGPFSCTLPALPPVAWVSRVSSPRFRVITSPSAPLALLSMSAMMTSPTGLTLTVKPALVSSGRVSPLSRVNALRVRSTVPLKSAGGIRASLVKSVPTGTCHTPPPLLTAGADRVKPSGTPLICSPTICSEPSVSMRLAPSPPRLMLPSSSPLTFCTVSWAGSLTGSTSKPT